MQDDPADRDIGAVIEQVLELVDLYARDQTGRSIDVDDIKQSLMAQGTASDDGNLEESVSEGRPSKHAPLLGAPFVV